MNGFAESLKADLLDRRMRPFVALVAVALLGALAYIVLGGSGESAPAAASAHPAPVGLRSGVAISPSTHEDALAETTSGGSQQHQQGIAKNPFGVLKAANAPTTSSSGSSSSSSSSSSGGSNPAPSGGSTSSGSSGTSTSSSSGGSAPTSSGSSGSSGSSKSKKSSGRPKTVYQLDALFGEVPASPGQSSQPQPYDDLKLLTPLPSRKVPLLVYRGVTAAGKRATFTVAGETILSGPGACKPSPYQCETLSLKEGQVERIAYLPPGSESAVTYELKIVSLKHAEASAATVESLWRGRSQAGLEVLRSGNLMQLPGLRESAVAGVLLPSR